MTASTVPSVPTPGHLRSDAGGARAAAPSQAGRTPGELVLHPVALGSLVLLLVNDHVLKGWGPGWLTGKLSDVAGLAFLPFLLVALHDVALRRDAPGVRSAVVAASSTGLLFAAVKLLDPVRSTAAEAAGLAREPLDRLAALLTGGAAPHGGPAVVVADPSDVLAVVACAAVVLVVRRRAAAAAGRT